MVEDDITYGEAMEGLLIIHEDLFDLVGWAKEREEIMPLVEQHVPDIVLMDLMLAREWLPTIEIISEIRHVTPSTQIVVLTAHFDDDKIFSAIRAGAVTYLVKDKFFAREEFSNTLMRVHKGDPPIDAGIARRIYEFYQAPNDNDTMVRLSQLTSRELEVLKLIAERRSNLEIATNLVITKSTVKTHVSNILKKLHLNNRTELTWWYKRQGV